MKVLVLLSVFVLTLGSALGKEYLAKSASGRNYLVKTAADSVSVEWSDPYHEASRRSFSSGSGVKIDECRDLFNLRMELNDSYIGPDLCNKCICLPVGNACTRLAACMPKPENHDRLCIDDHGILYKPGEQYTIDAGCNSCWCNKRGPFCTSKLCVMKEECVNGDGEVMAEGESWLLADGCNTCICGEIGPYCTGMKCMSQDQLVSHETNEQSIIVQEK